ncbi:MAG: hypothetical protein ACTSVY_11365 [Candidatus Helarchaeota archaeon]
MNKSCVICGEIVIKDGDIFKKHEKLGTDGYLCQDCLSIPIRCIKSSITLSEILHRIRTLRGTH